MFQNQRIKVQMVQKQQTMMRMLNENKVKTFSEKRKENNEIFSKKIIMIFIFLLESCCVATMIRDLPILVNVLEKLGCFESESCRSFEQLDFLSLIESDFLSIEWRGNTNLVDWTEIVRNDTISNCTDFNFKQPRIKRKQSCGHSALDSVVDVELEDVLLLSKSAVWSDCADT